MIESWSCLLVRQVASRSREEATKTVYRLCRFGDEALASSSAVIVPTRAFSYINQL